MVIRRVQRLLRRVSPAIFESLIKSDKPKTTGFTVPEIDKSSGEMPVVRFDLLNNVYSADIVAGSSVDFLWQQTIGPGFHTTMNEKETKHRTKVEMFDKTTPELNAEELIDIYNRSVNMLGLARSWARDLWGFGNAFTLIPQGNVLYPRYIPTTYVERIYRGEERDWIPTARYKVGYQFIAQCGGKIIKPSDMVHLLWNTVNDEAFGRGIIQRLCLRMPLGGGDTRIEPYKIAGKLQQAMIEQFEMFSSPNELWNFPRIDKNKLIAFDKKVKNLPRTGSRLTSNVENATARPVVAQRARGFDMYVKYLSDMYVIGTQTPATKFLTAEGFSEASIREIRRIMQPQIVGMQKFIKHSIEEMFWKPVLEKFGFDPDVSRVRLIWETAKVFEPEMMLRMLPFLIRMVENQSLKAPEFRRILRDMVGLPLDQDDDVEIITAAEKAKFGTSTRTGEEELAKKKRGPQLNP